LQQNCVAGGESQHDTDSWRKRAEDARAIAESMKSLSEKQKIEAIAAAYERLADHAKRSADESCRRGSRKNLAAAKTKPPLETEGS